MAKFPVTLKARLLLIDRGEVLLLKQTNINGGNYTLVGGPIEAKEFALQTLVRESKEEAGIVIEEKDLVLVHVLHKVTKAEHRINLYFKALYYTGNLRSRETKKFSDVVWFPINDLPPNITASARQVIGKYRQGILYSEQSK